MRLSQAPAASARVAPLPRLAVAGASVTLAPAVATTDTTAGGFMETVDITTPAGYAVPPPPWAPANGSIMRHLCDRPYWYYIEPMMARHGAMCQKSDDAIQSTHPVDSYQGMRCLCRNHLMTATTASGYGVTYMTPNHMVDFTSGEAAVRDLSM